MLKSLTRLFEIFLRYLTRLLEGILTLQCQCLSCALDFRESVLLVAGVVHPGF